MRSYLLNYGQAAVLTPSDFAFPLHATLGEAEPNAESVVISELDLTTLTHQRDLAACARSTTSSMIFMNCGLRKKSKLSERIDLRIGID